MSYTTDRFLKHSVLLDSPYVEAMAITDSNIFPASRAVYVGITGNLVAEMLTYDGSNTEITFMNVPQGTTLPIRIVRVDMSNTSANSLIALY